MERVALMDRKACRTCSGAIVWVVLVSGERHPIEPAEVEPGIGVVAWRPDTGKAMVLRGEHLTRAGEWGERYGVTFHRSHFASPACAAAERVNRDQAALF
jgi:hypothetical protein